MDISVNNLITLVLISPRILRILNITIGKHNKQNKGMTTCCIFLFQEINYSFFVGVLGAMQNSWKSFQTNF